MVPDGAAVEPTTCPPTMLAAPDATDAPFWNVNDLRSIRLASCGRKVSVTYLRSADTVATTSKSTPDCTNATVGWNALTPVPTAAVKLLTYACCRATST